MIFKSWIHVIKAMSIYAIMLVMIRETPGIKGKQQELVVYSIQGSQSMFIESARNGDRNSPSAVSLGTFAYEHMGPHLFLSLVT